MVVQRVVVVDGGAAVTVIVTVVVVVIVVCGCGGKVALARQQLLDIRMAQIAGLTAIKVELQVYFVLVSRVTRRAQATIALPLAQR